MTSPTILPFSLHVPDGVLDDLKLRLDQTRWPDQLVGSANADWEYGAELGFVKRLSEYWRDEFDWRAAEASFNGMGPQFKATGRGGRSIHYLHQRCTTAGRTGAPALLLAHGWPGSIYEFHRCVGPLAKSFHIIAPSIPGYGFSEPARGRGFNVPEAARDFHHLMTQVLGYQEYVAQGGDWGSMIVQSLGRLFPEQCRAIHINMATPGIRGDAPLEGLSSAEMAGLGRAKAFSDYGTGYQKIQATRPQTLSYALNDSPVGLLAWIVEKFRDWSDCGGDVESVHSKDVLLTNVMLYWVSQSIGSSMRLYYESMAVMPGTSREMIQLGATKCPVPTAVAQFPHELFYAPRKWCELSYNLKRYTAFASGGHFAALEKPAELCADIVEFFLRPGGGRTGAAPITRRSKL